jgi:hypothetical protein
MMLRRITAIAFLTAVVSTAVVSEGQAGGGTYVSFCGQLLTTNAYLIGDMYCPGSAGVVVRASGITIDLRGFTLLGDRSTGNYGIDDSGGYDHVTVKNGVVRNFGIGVAANSDAQQINVTGVLANGNVNDGIYVAGLGSRIQSTAASGNQGDGIHVEGPTARIQSSSAYDNGQDGISFRFVGISVGGTSPTVQIQSSTASGNDRDGIYVQSPGARIQSSSASVNGVAGIFVEGDSAKVQSSTASGNGASGSAGIAILGEGALLSGNRAEANGFLHSVSDLSGLGIYVDYSTTAPAGTNFARGNDDPKDCIPTSLC